MKTFYARNASEWRDWLELNHGTEREIWLVFYKKGTGRECIGLDEALDGALSFGWIDSMIRRLDDLSYARKFTPRRPDSVWSRSNIERAEALARKGMMTERGLALFRNGTRKVSPAEKSEQAGEDPPFPAEFAAALKENARAWKNFQVLAPSHRRRYLMWITSAQTPATRGRRIKEAVDLLAENAKPPAK